MPYPYTRIAIFIEGAEPIVTTLEHQITCDDGFADYAPEIRAAINEGATSTFSGGAEPAFTVISLEHRDAPIHAAKIMDLNQMSTLLSLFCACYGLPFKSADDLMAEASNHDLGNANIVNWLSSYVDAWNEVEERTK
jgi:hypothetical protein